MSNKRLQKQTAAPLDGPLGLLVERGALSKTWHTAAQPTLVLPLGSCVVQLTHDPSNEPVQIDRTRIALMPRGARYRLRSVSPMTEVLTLFIGNEAQQWACREYEPFVQMDALKQVLSSMVILPRTRWFDEIIHRYLFEREVCAKHTSSAAAFLETEIAKEIYFVGRESLAGKTRDTVVFAGNDVVARAREWIDAHLFERLKISVLARLLHTSESTLLRAFRRETGMSPASYQRGRRLDEAVLLLRAGRETVGEVAVRVGYANIAAFTVAFRRQFGVTPSSVRERGSGPLP